MNFLMGVKGNESYYSPNMRILAEKMRDALEPVAQGTILPMYAYY